MMNLPLLLIDGNNLSHAIYGHLDDQKLFIDLTNYLDRLHDSVSIELFLDDCHSQLPSRKGLKIITPPLSMKSDDDIFGRIIWHKSNQKDFAVISHDGEIVGEARRLGIHAYSARDFVLNYGSPAPYFALPSLLISKKRRPRDFSKEELDYFYNAFGSSEYLLGSPTEKEINEAPEIYQTSVDITLFLNSFPVQNENVMSNRERIFWELIQKQKNDLRKDTYVSLHLEQWNVKRGVYFLLGSFCLKHRKMAVEQWLRASKDNNNSKTLQILARQLVESCGCEPGFTTKGSTLDRIQRAILLRENRKIKLSRLCEQTLTLPKTILREQKKFSGVWIQVHEYS